MKKCNFNDSSMYRIQDIKGMKFARFHTNKVEINGEFYFFGSFVNSDKFIIHEVICFNKIHEGWVDEVFHVWYEDKKH